MSTGPRAAKAALAVALLAGVGSVITVAVTERPAYAQPKPKKKDPKKKAAEEEQKKKEADAAAAEEEEKRKKKAAEEEEAKKKLEQEQANEKKELDVENVEAERAVYFAADLAITRADLGAIVDNTGFDRTGAFGTMWGFSAGYRLKLVRAGLRFRIYDTTQFTLWSIAVSGGYTMPLRPLSPIFSGHLGYVFSQSLEPSLYPGAIPEGTFLPPKVDVKGVILGADVQASYWVKKWFRVGPFLGIDLMFLDRSKTDVPRSITGAPPAEITSHPIYTESGFGLGVNFQLGIRAAFDIGVE